MKKPGKIKNDLANTIEKKRVEEIDQLMEEFKSAVPVFTASGFSVANFQIDINTPPSLMIRIVGDITAIDTEALQTYIDENPDKKLMTVVLKGFQTAFKFQEKIAAIGMQYVIVDIKLSITPSITVNFAKALA